ncbi:Alpha/Beta hydrolase protein [Lasiosphaeria hispida]|uniref:Alpha/Beta hydrolase protein n=1 Tax=Lasiosphaeria hispida TaxID=260671 RepID=A0AAJ0HNA2_9PEZI|nr:Alpha/Beta hydrolase protein [Lasiosphaeria hispida]
MSHIELGKFERIDAVYKEVDGIPFEVSVIAPREVVADQCPARPVLIHFHGGGFILGTALDPQTLPLWQYAGARGAVIVSPCHRLLPEAKASQILEDIKDFWDWVYTSLASTVSDTWPKVSIDLSHIAAAGQGSGGTLALQSSFLWPQTGIKVIMAQYCAIDTDSPMFSPRPHDPPRDLDGFVTRYLQRIRPGTFRVSSPFPEYFDLLFAVHQTGRFRDMVGTDGSLRLRKNMCQAKAVPPIWMSQGAEDRIVSRLAADELVHELRIAHPKTPVLYSVLPGGHGFDVKHAWDETWVQEGVKFVDRFW